MVCNCARLVKIQAAGTSQVYHSGMGQTFLILLSVISHSHCFTPIEPWISCSRDAWVLARMSHYSALTFKQDFGLKFLALSKENS